MKDWCDWAEILICCSAHQELLNALFMTRSGQLFMKKRACGNFRNWETDQGEFGPLFLYPEIPEQIGQTQGVEEYCKVIE